MFLSLALEGLQATYAVNLRLIGKPTCPISEYNRNSHHFQVMADCWSNFRNQQGSLHFNVFPGGDPLRISI